MATDCPQQLTFWELQRQQVRADFAGGPVVTEQSSGEANGRVAEWFTD